MIQDALNLFSSVKGFGPDRFDPFVGDRGVNVFDRNQARRFYHSGDIGDIIYSLPTVRVMGGGNLLLGPEMRQDVKVTVRKTMTKQTVEWLRPLLELQDYVKGVYWASWVVDVDVDLNKFREELVLDAVSFRRTGRLANLAESHLKRFRLDIAECQRPWLIVDQVEKTEDKPVVIHRSSRWLNNDFPWDQVLRKYAGRIQFVGLQEEHAAFCNTFGSVDYHPVKSALEMARIVAGCELFVGNQSFPYSLAEGMKKTSLLEVWPDGPNCLFARPNGYYGLGKTVYIPSLKPTMNIEKLKSCPVCGGENATACRNGADIVRCDACAAVYLRTRMDADSMYEHYQRYADGDSHMRLPQTVDEVRTSGLRRDYFMTEIVECGDRLKRTLDIGSGWGAWLSNARNKGMETVGVEVCHKMADFANSVLGIQTHTEQFEDLRFPDNSFDLVTCLHSLEHLPYPGRAWLEITRILRPGGLFCGMAPNFDSFCSTELGDKWPWLDPNMHYVHYTVEKVKSLLLRQGFTILKLETAIGDFDRRLLGRTIQGKNAVPMGEEEMQDAVTKICQRGEGEEIRWIAKKNL
jgi:SAM-dependent methyltransferase